MKSTMPERSFEKKKKKQQLSPAQCKHQEIGYVKGFLSNHNLKTWEIWVPLTAGYEKESALTQVIRS